jgi:hypothetical protein
LNNLGRQRRLASLGGKISRRRPAPEHDRPVTAVLIVALSLADLALILLCIQQARVVEQIKDQLLAARQQVEHELELRQIYERALGLPIGDSRLRERWLWARADQGDELAAEILTETYFCELGEAAGFEDPGPGR